MQEILIEIDTVGNVKVEGKGFSGAECTKVTEAIEDALGEVESRKLKPEFRQTRTATNKAVK